MMITGGEMSTLTGPESRLVYAQRYAATSAMRHPLSSHHHLDPSQSSIPAHGHGHARAASCASAPVAKPTYLEDVSLRRGDCGACVPAHS